MESTLGKGSTFHLTLKLIRDRRKMPRVASGMATAVAEPVFWEPANRATAEANGAVILCAEDNATNRMVLGRVLDRLGVVYDMVEDGAQAMARLDRTRHGLLLTDGHMPVMDGWELVGALRATEEAEGLLRLPVLMATADAVSDVTGRAPAGAIDACLTKPLRRDLLDAAILKALPVVAMLRVPRIGSGPAAPVAPTVLDLSGLIDLVGNSQEDLRSVLADFQAGAMTQHSKLGVALAAGDREAVRMAAHALKGAAGYAGARTIADVALALEAEAKAGGALAGLNAKYDALTKTLASLPADIAASLAARFE